MGIISRYVWYKLLLLKKNIIVISRILGSIFTQSIMNSYLTNFIVMKKLIVFVHRVERQKLDVFKVRVERQKLDVFKVRVERQKLDMFKVRVERQRLDVFKARVESYCIQMF